MTRAHLMISALALISAPLTAAQGAGCLDDLTPNSGGAAFLSCLKEMQSVIEQLEDQFADREPSVDVNAVAASLAANHAGTLRGDPGPKGDKGDAAVVPAAAIIASTRPCASLGNGWSEYSEAAGRFILGVGKGPLATQVAQGAAGGEERVVLSRDEMPSHQHTLQFVPEVSNLNGASYPVMSDIRHSSSSRRNAVTESTGKNKSHNNMPPYIALYFCRKEAG